MYIPSGSVERILSLRIIETGKCSWEIELYVRGGNISRGR